MYIFYPPPQLFQPLPLLLVFGEISNPPPPSPWLLGTWESSVCTVSTRHLWNFTNCKTHQTNTQLMLRVKILITKSRIVIRSNVFFCTVSITKCDVKTRRVKWRNVDWISFQYPQKLFATYLNLSWTGSLLPHSSNF